MKLSNACPVVRTHSPLWTALQNQVLMLLACTVLTSCGGSSNGPDSTATTPPSASVSVPIITSFTASPASISAGASSMLSWASTGAGSISITPGMFTAASASGFLSVSPTSTTTYSLSASNAAGMVTATATVTVSAASAGGPLAIITTSCPDGTQGTAYVGCTISVSGGTPPYSFATSTNVNYPTLPEGLALNATSGQISSKWVGAQGTYAPLFLVNDATHAQATQQISFAITGSNAFLTNIFPSDSIFHHRVDAASTGLPVDTSPAAALSSSDLPSTIKPFFGHADGAFPNGIPVIQVPANQANVSVTTTEYQSYFTSGPIPANAPVEGSSQSTGDRHVLVYRATGGASTPALYEMWQGIYEGGPWTDSSNALWPDVSSNALTPQGMGTSDAAGLPIAPLLANADEVIGSGTPSAPSGAVVHPIRFTVNRMLSYWVWPATTTAGSGTCTSGSGTIPAFSLISQSMPPVSCTSSGPAGEIYRLKASVSNPSCAATSPQAAIVITGLRNYGIILADNGGSGGLIGTPDARWNDDDLRCLRALTLADFEPVNVSSLMVSNDSGATSH
jgi:hypothetical protein